MDSWSRGLAAVSANMGRTQKGNSVSGGASLGGTAVRHPDRQANLPLLDGEEEGFVTQPSQTAQVTPHSGHLGRLAPKDHSQETIPVRILGAHVGVLWVLGLSASTGVHMGDGQGAFHPRRPRLPHPVQADPSGSMPSVWRMSSRLG